MQSASLSSLAAPVMRQLQQARDHMPPWLMQLQQKPLAWLNLMDLPLLEPDVLHLRTPQTQVGSPLQVETFEFLLSQLPGLKQLVWAGPGDPFSMSTLSACLQSVHRHSPELSLSLHSSGEYLDQALAVLDAVALQSLRINLMAHTPSGFWRTTRRQAAEFPQRVKAIRRLLTRRVHRPFANPEMTVELVLQVGMLSLGQLDDMIQFAEALGVDSLILENTPPRTTQGRDPDTLYSDDRQVRQVLAALKPEDYRIQIVLPALFSASADEQRFCVQPATTVSVALDTLAVSPCTQWPLQEPPVYVYDGDFWNRPINQALRQVHWPSIVPQAIASKALPEVPPPCRSCQNNCQPAGQETKLNPDLFHRTRPRTATGPNLG